MVFIQRVLALAAITFATAAYAAPNVVVDAVQYPAWLERGGRAVPLMPGTELEPRDRLRTGNNARVQLKLAEGSTVKLGEQAQFVVERAQSRGVFTATLAVLSGAFRFTTDPQSKGRREVEIKVKNVTAGVRGTDLWGKSTDERDIVCLLEGRITVGSEGHPTVSLDSPLDFYQRKRDQSPVVSKVEPAQVQKWAEETELARDGAVGRAGGRWRVIAGTFSSRNEALALSRTLRANGYPSEAVDDRGIYAVQVPGLAGENEARALMANLRGVPGVGLPSVLPMP